MEIIEERTGDRRSRRQHQEGLRLDALRLRRTVALHHRLLFAVRRVLHARAVRQPAVPDRAAVDAPATLTLPASPHRAHARMAIDANVLINERLREELRAAPRRRRDPRGYERRLRHHPRLQRHHADRGLALLIFGSGPVRGFAVVARLGILTSIFSSVVVSGAWSTRLRHAQEARARFDRQHGLEVGRWNLQDPQRHPFMRHALAFNVCRCHLPSRGVLPRHQGAELLDRVHRRHGDGGALQQAQM